ncbi:Protein-cysteine N-palmitoyltransferase HHAT [Folsomia candida]|uniref:Protein-cysteine N-palmitoyltransferase HHAT n=1 Tax=Folsomia candida TaxID=158441 RepID=A0A226EV02_FOLCA|nr:Protein-cysteine N-palmitoyltransferase HHAT [Folsomia candida]
MTSSMRNGSEVYSRRHRRDNLLQEKYRNNNGSEELGQGDDGTVRKKGTKGNQRTTTCEDEEFANVSTWYLVVIAVVRLLACVGWGWGILYATYHVYMAAERHLPFQREPDINPGIFSEQLGRGRDSSDYEWVTFSPLLWTKLIIANLTYQLLKLLFSNYQQVLFTLDNGQSENCLYIFIVASAWSLSRGVSFCMDVWDRPDNNKLSVQSLFYFEQYVFYLPLSHCGPLITYEHFENEIIFKKFRSKFTHNFFEIGKKIFKLLLTTVLIELIYHYLYFRAVALTISLISKLNIWAICGTVYWLGQIFTLKYKVLYGLPSSLAEFDGLTMYPLISCPAYIHRYSVLWKDFDRGLYTFMVKYIYCPSIQKFNSLDPSNIVPSDLKKLAASFITFCYVFIWHSTSFDVLVWTAFNFLGITFERFGSLIKRKMDHAQKLRPISWDFLIEPLICVPLAGMSILNSSIFCGTYDAAEAFYNKLSSTWTARYNYHIGICFFLYCFTHVGVTVRTWVPFSKAISKRLIFNR